MGGQKVSVVQHTIEFIMMFRSPNEPQNNNNFDKLSAADHICILKILQMVYQDIFDSNNDKLQNGISESTGLTNRFEEDEDEDRYGDEDEDGDEDGDTYSFRGGPPRAVVGGAADGSAATAFGPFADILAVPQPTAAPPAVRRKAAPPPPSAPRPALPADELKIQMAELQRKNNSNEQ